MHSRVIMMLWKYVSPVDDRDESQAPKVVNVEYGKLCVDTQKGKKRGTYQKLSDEEKATVAKFASNHGVASATRKFKDYNLAKSTVRDWRNLYQRKLVIKAEEAKREGKVGEEICLDALPSKKRGKPPLLGVNLDCYLQKRFLE